MRISNSFVFLAIALAALDAPAHAAENEFYVPFVHARAADPSLSPHLGTCLSSGLEGSYWLSDVSYYNTGSGPGTYRTLDAYGKGVQIDSFCAQPSVLQAGEAGSGFCLSGVSLGFARVSATPGIEVAGSVRREDHWYVIGSLYGIDVSQGSTPLPVFTAPFPANTETTTGPVELGFPGLSVVSCAPANQQYVRRVNVTLLNAGTSPATFRVTARIRHPVEAPQTVMAADKTYVVDARDVVQINAIELNFPGRYPDGSWPSWAKYWGWFFITADQPFLSYVSTVMNDPEPKALPFAVYPSKPIN